MSSTNTIWLASFHSSYLELLATKPCYKACPCLVGNSHWLIRIEIYICTSKLQGLLNFHMLVIMTLWLDFSYVFLISYRRHIVLDLSSCMFDYKFKSWLNFWSVQCSLFSLGMCVPWIRYFQLMPTLTTFWPSPFDPRITLMGTWCFTNLSC